MNVAAVIQEQRAALSYYVRNRSAALCFEYSPEDIEGGSAVCIEIENRLFIATAAHNFERLREKPNWSVFSANRSSNSPLTILQANYSAERQQGESDVAWLEIDARSAADSDLVGIELEGLCVNPILQPGEVYVATGLPRDLKQIFQEENGHRNIIMPLGMYFTTVVDADIAAGYGGLIVLDYMKDGVNDKGEPIEVEPYGMSGGGIWHTSEDAPPEGVWNPQRLQLLGLNREYFRSKGRLTAEPLHAWLTLLRNDLSELEQAIDPLFQ